MRAEPEPEPEPDSWSIVPFERAHAFAFIPRGEVKSQVQAKAQAQAQAQARRCSAGGQTNAWSRNPLHSPPTRPVSPEGSDFKRLPESRNLRLGAHRSLKLSLLLLRWPSFGKENALLAMNSVAV